MDEEKTRAEKAEVNPNPRLDQGEDEACKTANEKKDISLGTIHMIGGPKCPDLENIIRGEIQMIWEMNEVLSIQSTAKKPR